MTLVANKYFGCCDHNKYRAIFDSLPRHARVLEVGCGSGQMIR
jgi:tRNA G46 methylase TrmB